jgi:hypothetical protein
VFSVCALVLCIVGLTSPDRRAPPRSAPPRSPPLSSPVRLRRCHGLIPCDARFEPVLSPLKIATPNPRSTGPPERRRRSPPASRRLSACARSGPSDPHLTVQIAPSARSNQPLTGQ